MDAPDYHMMLQRLQRYDTGPLQLRIGGSSTDAMTERPRREVWDAMARIRSSTGVHFVLGLPFERSWSQVLGDGVLADAAATLPDWSVAAYEIGNEARGWLAGAPGQGRGSGSALGSGLRPRVQAQGSGSRLRALGSGPGFRLRAQGLESGARTWARWYAAG